MNFRLPLQLIVVSVSCAGCALPNSWKWPTIGAAPSHVAATTAAVAADGAEHTTVNYRTSTDRINVHGGGFQFASSQPGQSSLLPAMTQATLRVEFPHPQFGADWAQASLHYPADGRDAKAIGPAVRVLDIPASQAKTLVDKLEQQQFFRRSKTLAAESFVGVNRDGKKFGKDFRALAEYDALLIRVAIEGQPTAVPVAFRQ